MSNDPCTRPAASAADVQPARKSGALLRASEVERHCEAAAPLAQILAWIRSFLARSHPDLGRSGPVCPFTPMALNLDTIWLAEIDDTELDLRRAADLLREYRARFLEAEPRDAGAINKAVLVVFPNLGANACTIIDEVQYALKPEFVEVGLMLGEFHAANSSPGLRNPAFFPLRSPVPMLAIRHIVETDLPFLRRPGEPPQRRAAYARAYLRQLGAGASRNNFEQAVEALIDAELEVRATSTNAVDIPACAARVDLAAATAEPTCP